MSAPWISARAEEFDPAQSARSVRAAYADADLRTVLNFGQPMAGFASLWERVAEMGVTGVVNSPNYTARIADAYREAHYAALERPNSGQPVRRLIGKQGPAFGDRPSSAEVEVAWPVDEDWPYQDDASYISRCGNWPNGARISALEAVFTQLSVTHD